MPPFWFNKRAWTNNEPKGATAMANDKKRKSVTAKVFGVPLIRVMMKLALKKRPNAKPTYNKA